MAVNKVILIGNLGADPETKNLEGGNTVANFTIATTEKWKNKQGEQQEKTEWHRIVAFGRTAEVCGEYLKKGKQVYIEGKLQTRKWENKEGVTVYTTEIVCNLMQMLGTRGDEAQQDPFAQAQKVVNRERKVALEALTDNDVPF